MTPMIKYVYMIKLYYDGSIYHPTWFALFNYMSVYKDVKEFMDKHNGTN